MTVKLLTKHHLEFLSLKGGCTGSSESTLVKMPHCWKSHVAAQITKFATYKISIFELVSGTERNGLSPISLVTNPKDRFSGNRAQCKE